MKLRQATEDLNMQQIVKKEKDIINLITKYLSVKFNQARREKKISLRKISKLTQISPSNISEFECGRKLIRMSSLIRLAIALELSLEDILQEFINLKENVKDSRKLLEQALVGLGISKNSIEEIKGYVNYRLNLEQK